MINEDKDFLYIGFVLQVDKKKCLGEGWYDDFCLIIIYIFGINWKVYKWVYSFFIIYFRIGRNNNNYCKINLNISYIRLMVFFIL